MSCGTWALLNSQFLGTLLLAVTLVILIWYAWETRRIANASYRPVLVLDAKTHVYDVGAGFEQATEGRVLRGEIDGEFEIRNVGPGPAFEIWIKMRGGEVDHDFFHPHCEAGKAFPVGLPSSWLSKREVGTQAKVDIRYRGVGGAFRTRYTLVSRRRARKGGLIAMGDSFVAVSKLTVPR
jgi:hypothetical protein